MNRIGLCPGAYGGAAANPMQALIDMLTVDGAGSPSNRVGGLWLANDLTKLFQNSGGTGAVTTDTDPVGYVGDSSAEGINLIQATANDRPLYRTSGGLHWLQFDGTSDFLANSTTLSQTQPWSRVSCFRPAAFTTNDTFFGPTSGFNGYLYQNGASPSVVMYDGANGPTSLLFTVGNIHVAIEEHNGASSSLQHNNDAASTGNPSTGSRVGLRVGNDTGSNFAQFDLFGVFEIDRLLTTAEKNTARTKIGALGGLVL